MHPVAPRLSELLDRPAREIVGAVTGSDIWRWAETRLTETTLHLRWDHTAHEAQWGELHVLVTGDAARRFDVGWRTSDALQDADALLALRDAVVAYLEEKTGTGGRLIDWLGGPGNPEAGLETEERFLSLLTETWRPGEVIAEGWRWIDLIPTDHGGWTLELVNGARRHHVVVAPGESARVEILDYQVGGTGGCVAEARARVQLALGLAAGAGGAASDGDRTPAPARLEPILDEQAMAHFEREGYVVVPGLVPEPLITAVKDAVHWFLTLDPTFDARYFYEILPYRDPMAFPGAKKPGFLRSGNFLEFYQHQALWDVRQAPQIHQVFAEIWGRRDLWVSLDRVNMKPPVSEAPVDRWRDPGFVHWDVDTSELPLPFGVQGLVAMTDMGSEHGTFHCAPGMHLKLPAWAEAQGPDRDHYRPPEGAFEMTSIPLRAGDLLVWHHGLPHGNGMNRADAVRIVQYVSMFPVDRINRQARVGRIRAWRERLPGGDHFEGDPLAREVQHGVTAELTPLGRRLLGLESWETV